MSVSLTWRFLSLVCSTLVEPTIPQIVGSVNVGFPKRYAPPRGCAPRIRPAPAPAAAPDLAGRPDGQARAGPDRRSPRARGHAPAALRGAHLALRARRG